MRRFAFAALLLLGGCASSTIRPLRPFEIATAPYRTGSATAVQGSLAYEAGCLLFRPDDGSAFLLPVWPSGTLFEESLLTFHQPGRADQRLVLAQEVELHGLQMKWTDLDSRRFAPFQRQCAAQPFYVTDAAPAN